MFIKDLYIVTVYMYLRHTKYTILKYVFYSCKLQVLCACSMDRQAINEKLSLDWGVNN